MKKIDAVRSRVLAVLKAMDSKAPKVKKTVKAKQEPVDSPPAKVMPKPFG